MTVPPRLEVSLFSEAFEQYGSKVSKDELLVVEGEIQHDEYNGGTALRASRILTIDEARQRFSRGLELDFSRCGLPQGFNAQLVQPHRALGTVGSCPIVLLYQHAGAVARIVLGDPWRVQASDDLLQALTQEFGQDHVKLTY